MITTILYSDSATSSMWRMTIEVFTYTGSMYISRGTATRTVSISSTKSINQIDLSSIDNITPYRINITFSPVTAKDAGNLYIGALNISSLEIVSGGVVSTGTDLTAQAIEQALVNSSDGVDVMGTIIQTMAANGLSSDAIARLFRRNSSYISNS